MGDNHASLVKRQFPNLHYKYDNDTNTLRPEQNGWHFADDIFKSIFLNEMFNYSNITDGCFTGFDW